MIEVYLIIGAIYAFCNYQRELGMYRFVRDVFCWAYDIFKNLKVKKGSGLTERVMSGERFVENIMALPLSTSFKDGLKRPSAINDMKSEWEESSAIERKVWFASLRLRCLAGYVDEFGCIPEEHIATAFDICAVSAQTVSLQKSAGLGSGMSHYMALSGIRKVGLGCCNDIKNDKIQNVQGFKHKHCHNEFLYQLSEDATVSDCYLYNVMLHSANPEVVKTLTSRYYNVFAEGENSGAGDDKRTNITSALDTTFDKVFNSQSDPFNSVQQIELAIRCNKVKNPVIATGFISDLYIKISGVTRFSKYKTDEKVYTILAILFLFALLPMPYEFYNTLRTLVCVGLGYFLYSTCNEGGNNPIYKYGLVGLIILYNPLMPIHLTKSLWTVINIATLYFIYYCHFKKNSSDE